MKTHIICEDSVSGFIFWKAINKHIFNNICTIHSAGGVTNIISKVDELIDYGSIQSGDRVILVFDNTGHPQASKTLKGMKGIVKANQLYLIYTTYYCFEEVLISFRDLDLWVNSTILKDKEVNDMLKFIRERIMNAEKWDKAVKVEYMCTLVKITGLKEEAINSLNRENLALNIIQRLTLKSVGFKVNKDTLGICWIDDCCELEKHILNNPNTKVTKFIRKCGLENEITAYDKIYQIAQNSVFDRGKIKLGDLEHLVLNHKI